MEENYKKTKTNKFPWQGGADSPGVAESPLLSPGEKIFYETKGRKNEAHIAAYVVNCSTR